MSLGRLVVLLLVVGTLDVLLHRYAWIRLVRDAQLPAPWGRIATFVLVFLGLLLVIALPLGRYLPRAVMAPFAFVAFTWLGVLFLLVVLLLIGDVVRVIDATVDPDPARRHVLNRMLAAGTSIVAAGVAGWGVKSALADVAVHKMSVPLAKLPASMAGLTLVQLTDVHIGPTIGHDWLARVVAKVNALAPDVIVITGDLVDGSVDDLREHVAPLRDLKAKHGVFFVTGNHEYYSGVDSWMKELARLGIRVLRNERVELKSGSDSIDLAGVDDWSARGYGHGHGPDLARALEGRDPSRALVLLAHQPKQIVQAAKLGVGLQLSGHTHGGQIFPWNFMVRLQQPYVAGLHEHEGAFVYVSRGTGYWGPPMRVGIPAEITHITLQASA
ncbi:MAG: metallophosphoesterase [Polyangiales bacterium]